MGKIISIISTIIFVWAIFVGVEYLRSYQGDEKLLLTLNTETTKEYTKRTGLGFSIVEYDIPRNEIKNGTILKEFYIFNFRVGKTIAVV